MGAHLDFLRFHPRKSPVALRDDLSRHANYSSSESCADESDMCCASVWDPLLYPGHPRPLRYPLAECCEWESAMRCPRSLSSAATSVPLNRASSVLVGRHSAVDSVRVRPIDLFLRSQDSQTTRFPFVIGSYLSCAESTEPRTNILRPCCQVTIDSVPSQCCSRPH